LSKEEVQEVRVATDAYNASIEAIANAKGLAFVNANALQSQIAQGGIVANNYTVTSAYVTGGGFSLDGVHPSPRGYALIANAFFSAINETYGSNFKGVNIGLYRILYPMDPANF
jgi:lysophospholipase L1-like esterase